jgi:hypothetical protein
MWSAHTALGPGIRRPCGPSRSGSRGREVRARFRSPIFVGDECDLCRRCCGRSRSSGVTAGARRRTCCLCDSHRRNVASVRRRVIIDLSTPVDASRALAAVWAGLLGPGDQPSLGAPFLARHPVSSPSRATGSEASRAHVRVACGSDGRSRRNSLVPRNARSSLECPAAESDPVPEFRNCLERSDGLSHSARSPPTGQASTASGEQTFEVDARRSPQQLDLFDRFAPGAADQPFFASQTQPSRFHSTRKTRGLTSF